MLCLAVTEGKWRCCWWSRLPGVGSARVVRFKAGQRIVIIINANSLQTIMMMKTPTVLSIVYSLWVMCLYIVLYEVSSVVNIDNVGSTEVFAKPHSEPLISGVKFALRLSDIVWSFEHSADKTIVNRRLSNSSSLWGPGSPYFARTLLVHGGRSLGCAWLCGQVHSKMPCFLCCWSCDLRWAPGGILTLGH